MVTISYILKKEENRIYKGDGELPRLKCSFNKLIDIEFDSNGRKTKRYITVSNTYPVLQKIREDLEKGVKIPYDIQKRKHGKSISKYIQEVTMNLIRYNKELYLDYIGDDSRHEILKKFGDSSLEQITYNGFKLLFLKSKEDFILLNYIPITHNYYPLTNYIIAKFRRNRSYHIHELNIFGQIMIAINTYDAFMAFSRINKKKANLGMNRPFFSSFNSAVTNGWSVKPEKTSNYCDDVQYIIPEMIPLQHARFHYYRIFNKLIVNEYEEVGESKEINNSCDEDLQ